MRHRFAVTNFLAAGFRTVQVTARHATRLGATLPKKVATGEVVSIGTTDFDHVGYAMDISARGRRRRRRDHRRGRPAARRSVPLGLVVVIGVPLLVAVVGLLLKPLHQRRRAQRELTGALTGRAADIVSGLRVLRGIGGEDVVSGRYRAESQQVRAAGVRVAKVESVLEGAQILLPGLFVALVTWLGARFAVAGRITPGELVAFYATPCSSSARSAHSTEFAEKLTRGLVAAGRVVTLLRIEPELRDPADPADSPPRRRRPRRPRLRLRRPATAASPRSPPPAPRTPPPSPTGSACSTPRPGAAAGRTAAATGTRRVRSHVVVADNDDRLFRGRLRDELGDRPGALAALDAASAQDIIDALPDGLDAEVAERGRDFSGGQQQRLRLARALLADPPVLILVDPTCAVDAHTEARIADRLRRGAGRPDHRRVAPTSPLLLDRADTVAFLDDGRLVAAPARTATCSTPAPPTPRPSPREDGLPSAAHRRRPPRSAPTCGGW